LFALLPLLPQPENVRTYFDGWYYALGFVLLGLLSVSAWIGARMVRVRGPARPIVIRPVVLDVLFVLTIGAYVVWFFEILANPALLLLAVEMGAFAIREQVLNIPGITSFTQAGVVFFICYVVAARYCMRELHWRFHVYAAVILALTVIRVFVWTERLALLEIVVPVIILLVGAGGNKDGSRKLGHLAAPFVAIFLMIVLFGVTEYFRSWLELYRDQADDFWSFMLQRLSNYYVTSVNNAVSYLTEDTAWPRWDGQYVFSGLYAMPIVGDALRTELELRPDSFSGFLLFNLDPEFNNFSGIFFPVVDFGIAGGLLATDLIGLVAGMAWRHFASRSLGGLLFYPLIYMALIEIVRIFYFGGARTVIPLFLLALVYLGGFRRLRFRPQAVRVTSPTLQASG
jgi:oligosaccharide repeat unit polymerase